MFTFRSRPSSFRRAAGAALLGLLVSALSVSNPAAQSRTVADRVYSDAQAARGQAAYKAQCLACHGDTLQGVVGPPLAGNGFLAVWGSRPLSDLVDKIQKTMPPQAPGSVSQQQAIDV